MIRAQALVPLSATFPDALAGARSETEHLGLKPTLWYGMLASQMMV